MRKIKKLLLFKLLKSILFIFRDLILAVRNYRPFKWLFYIFKLYTIIFAVLGSSLMGFHAMDLHSYSTFIYETMEFYLRAIKDILKNIFGWLFRKIFGEDLDSLEPEQSTPKPTASNSSGLYDL